MAIVVGAHSHAKADDNRLPIRVHAGDRQTASAPDAHERAPKSPPAPASASPTQPSGRNDSSSDPADNHRMVLATIAGAIFAAVQTVALLITFWLMRRTSQHQLRAYLVVDTSEITRLQAGELVEASVRLTNVGQTPAFDVHYSTGVSVLEYPTDSLPRKEPSPPLTDGTHRYFISKPSEIVKQSNEVLTADDLQAIAEGKNKRIYVHGTVFYKDIFRKKHKSKFCLTIHGRPPQLLVEFYRSGNEAT